MYWRGGWGRGWCSKKVVKMQTWESQAEGGNPDNRRACIPILFVKQSQQTNLLAGLPLSLG